MYITDLYEDDLELAIKVVIVGNGAVGKSSLIQRYCRGIFTNGYKKTIGVDFLEKQLRVMSEDVRLMLWDTAGQEEFDAITKAYYRGAQACVVAFSTTDRASFEAVQKWKRKVEDECGRIPMVLVQNKIDLMHQAQVQSDEVERLSRELNMLLYRTSVKEDLNVGSVFQQLAENYVAKVRSFENRSACANNNNTGHRLMNNMADPFSDSMQIGGGRGYNHPATANSRLYPAASAGYGVNGGVLAGANRHHLRLSNGVTIGGYCHQQQQQQQQQQPNNKTKKKLSTTTPTSNSSSTYQSPLHRSQATSYHSGNGYRGFSPQDYLNNPMFDALHPHRRYWRSAGLQLDRSTTITLGSRPLGSGLAGLKKGSLYGRSAKDPFGTRNCKVL